MFKTPIAMLLTAMSVTSAYAGTMGPVSVENHALFATAEGAYTWSQLGDVTLNRFSLRTDYNGWGGRLAVGATHYTSTPWSYTAELGWAYFANKDFKNETVGVRYSRDNIYGMDLLAGISYRYDMFDLFAKVGGLIESEQQKQKIDLTAYQNNGSFTGYSSTKFTMTNILPEIKVGGVYNFNPELGISLAYMHAFGNSTSVNIVNSRTGYTNSPTYDQQVRATTAPVSLDSVLLGLRYSFA